MSPLRLFLVPCTLVAIVAALVNWAASTPVAMLPSGKHQPVSDLADSVREVDAFFEARWRAAGLDPAGPAADLQLLHRLSLALHGTVPSLEEIRRFEADSQPDRLLRWTQRMLDDNRFADYFAERLARAFVGTEGGQFIVYRRGRFTQWLSEQLRQNRPYDEVVRTMITDEGLWTGTPSTNFITAAVVEGDVDENKLAGRTARAFLGQRIDCAQCHDAFFSAWKQRDFEGLAAFFGQTRVTLAGVEDKPLIQGWPVEFTVEDGMTLQQRTVAPRVPFHPEWLPDSGSRRRQLAAWLTHHDNRRFARAAVNRVWGSLFGRPYREPVDDLPDPPGPGEPDLLDILADDFRRHGYDLRRLVLLITTSRPFRLDSSHESADETQFAELESAWAVFPLTRLRPEQVIGSMLQAASVRTIDRNSHLLVRTIRFFRERDFVNEYCDPGERELDGGTRTIPQALQLINGQFTTELSEANFFNASQRIAGVAATDERCLETCYLVCLTRRPTADEADALLPQLRGTAGDERRRAVEDLVWALFNSEEFSWNH